MLHRYSSLFGSVKLVLKRGFGNESCISSKPLLVSIEGNIGAGKSTLLGNLRQRGEVYSFIDEPVGVWSALKNERSESLLEVYYKDRKRWSYTFQSCAILSRFRNIEKSISNAIETSKVRNLFLTERCLDTDYYVFTKMLVADGSIDKLEFDIYKRLFDHLKSTAVPLAAIIYVNTPPLVCLDRIRLRGREGEGDIPLEYLQNLAKFQDAWLSSSGVPVLSTDGTSVDDVTKFLDGLKS